MKHAILSTAMFDKGFATDIEGVNSGDDLCKMWGDFAVKVMTLRQQEAPISEVMKIVSKAGERRTLRALTLDAYEQPAFSTKEAQKRAVDSFRNQVELAYYKRPF